jgi:hypothetical protein
MRLGYVEPISREVIVARNQDKQESAGRKLGGWKHPLAAVLLLVAIGWVVATIFATTDNDFPKVGEVPGLFGLGQWNIVIGMGFILAAFGFAMKWE